MRTRRAAVLAACAALAVPGLAAGGSAAPPDPTPPGLPQAVQQALQAGEVVRNRAGDAAVWWNDADDVTHAAVWRVGDADWTLLPGLAITPPPEIEAFRGHRPYGLRAVLSDQGDVLLAWAFSGQGSNHHFGAIAYSVVMKADAAAWGPVQPMGGPQPMRVVFAPDGTAWALLTQFGGDWGADLLRRRPPGGEWGPGGLDVSASRRSSSQLAMNARGDMVVSWFGFRDTDGAVWAAVRPAGGEFDEPVKLTPGDVVAFGFGGVVPSITDDGGVTVHWRSDEPTPNARYTSTRTVAGAEWATRFEVVPFPRQPANPVPPPPPPNPVPPPPPAAPPDPPAVTTLVSAQRAAERPAAAAGPPCAAWRGRAAAATTRIRVLVPAAGHGRSAAGRRRVAKEITRLVRHREGYRALIRAGC